MQPIIYSKQSGLTFTEVIIAIVILVILIMIGMVAYNSYMRRNHYKVIVKAAIPYKQGIENCFQLTGALNNCDAGSFGIPPDVEKTKPSDLYKSIIVKNDGIIVITPRPKYGIQTTDTYVLTPKVARGVITWVTSGGGVEAGYAN